MEVSLGMHMINSLDHLVYDFLNFSFRHFLFLLNNRVIVFVKISGAILKDQIQLSSYFKKLNQFYYIRMLQF